METINNIVIFDNDQYLLALLKGYCYANSMTINALQLSLDGIRKLEILKPDVVIVPLNLICAAEKLNEANSLRRVSISSDIKICAFSKNQNDYIEPALSEWLDVIKNNLFDIDRYFKSIDGLNNSFPEKRSFKERRAMTDRRVIRSSKNFKNGENKNENLDFLRESEMPAAMDFKIDFRNKCLFINAHKVDLTPKEFELLDFLARDVDRVFMTDEILNHLWHESNRATKSDLYQYMHLLRKKIEIDPNNPQLILNIKGFGYKLNIGKPEKFHQALPKPQELYQFQ